MSTERPIDKKLSVNEDDVKTFGELVNRNRKNHKFQVFKLGRKTITPINFTSPDELISLCAKYHLQGISCISVNPTVKTRQATDSITDIENLYYDIDVNKDRKVNEISTPEDKKIAIDTSQEIVRYLSEVKNLQSSLLINSGNGGHIAIPVDINLDGFFTGKTEKENKEKWDSSEIKGRMLTLQKELQNKFGNDVVEVDCISADIIRRVKVPGTWNVKDDMKPEEYRRAGILKAYPRNIEPLVVESNTTVFNDVEPYKKPEVEPSETKIVDFNKLLKKDKKLNDLFTGDWQREPYSLEADGTPKNKWTRSEAEHMLICKLVWYDFSKEQIFSIMENCKIGKWKDATDAYKKHQYESAQTYINKHGGTKTTSRQIPIENNEKQIATLTILNRNKFSINNGDNVIFPPTETKASWHSSAWHRTQIVKALIQSCKMIKPEAEEIVNKLCNEAGKKINWLERRGAFSESLEDKKQEILDSIKKVAVIRSEDNNIYQIYLNGKTIQMTDKELYSGAQDFCVKYLNRFLKKIVISGEEWNNYFLTTILSEGILEPETEEVSSTGDVVTEKFLQYVRNKKVYDWGEVDKRKGYRNALYYDKERQNLFVSSDFVNKFFEGEKITREYKIKTIAWASHLHDKGYLTEKRTTQRVGNERRTSFWVFSPAKLGVTEDNIEKREKEQIETKNLEEYGDDNNK